MGEIELLNANAELYAKVYTFVKIWIAVMGSIFIALLIRYSFGVGFSAENPNPHKNETFAMPRGVFRGILTLSLLFIVLLLEVVSIQGKVIAVGDKLLVPEEMYRELMVAFQMMLAFYFGSKVVHHMTSVDKTKSENIAKAIAQSAKPTESFRSEFDESGAAG